MWPVWYMNLYQEVLASQKQSFLNISWYKENMHACIYSWLLLLCPLEQNIRMHDLDRSFHYLSSCLPIPHFTWVWLRHSVAWLVYFSPKPPHPLSKQVKLFNIFRKELSLHFQHLSIPVMLFLINKVQKECTAVVKAVRITRSQYIREAVKKGIF